MPPSPALVDVSATRGVNVGEGGIIDRRFLRVAEWSSLVAIAAIATVAYLLDGTYLLPFILVFSFAIALIDTGFGMGYGTLATPVLLVVGFKAVTIVPAVLIAQGVAACVATALHVRYRNINLTELKSHDLRISAAIIGFGVLGVVAAVILAVSLPPLYVKVYIGLLVMAAGLLLLARPRIRFSWPKVYAISAVNGFDKAISGGGFGPIAVGGLLSLGHRIRNSIGIAVFTVTIINFAGVILYLLLAHVTALEIYLMTALTIGAVMGALVGPGLTGRLNTKSHVSGLAFGIVAVGALALVTTFVKL